ncbi:hypothetical protein LSTR_LSTR013939 [Laodelphax striatellus]|uniref:Uncharacterized protein n=1 Tax=Laodelphax striatellus TaxID=195883 RepID=A0A482WRV4_LAOST|nr:hypothetical protein LSTR_LSTR013939 [Laodelphax striatellus]
MANRTKSLMKPLRREPLQDLPMITAANSDEDTTSTITLAALAKRRVSFSGRNSVKEYVPCAEPICVMSTPAYEETYAHLSSDSSGLCNNSGQNDENNMSQTLVNKMSLNRPHLVAPSARNQNNRIVPQPLRNSLPHQQVATLAATHDDSLNTSDMCMTEPI